MRFYRFISVILWPLSWCFGLVTYIRRLLYRKGVLKSRGVDVATIDIGNLAVGGTGKTPHSQYVIDLLSKEFNIAFLSRGYGRRSKGYHSTKKMKASEISAQTIGDEPFMLFLKNPEIPISVDADRYAGALNIISENPDLDAIVLDDAFQHLDFKCGMHILLTEYEKPVFNDKTLPSGRLREWLCATKYADIVIVTKVPGFPKLDISDWRRNLKLEERQHLFFTRVKYNEPKPVTEKAENTTITKETPAVVLTGIAHPQPLIEHLKSRVSVQQHLEFPDHHNFSDKEIGQIAKKLSENNPQAILLTTEKDWARICSNNDTNMLSLLPAFVVSIDIEFIDKQEETIFRNILKDYVQREKK